MRTPGGGHPGWILQPGQVLTGTYRIETMVGSPGGMGQVFAAEDTRLKAKVALKVPSVEILHTPGGPERFLREARIAARLRPHPHIVLIYACLTDPDLKIPVGGEDIPIPFIVMEYLGGGDLARLLKEGPVDFTVASVLFGNICSALQYAHSHVYKEGDKTIRGVIHRDLKPENICFDESGRVVLVDFGIARALGERSSSYTMAGTPTYMAPEQWNPAMGVDHRTDIYALGVILFQMVTGQLPFDPDTYEGLVAGHLTQKPPDPRTLRSDLLPGVAAAVLKAMEKEKNARFDSVEQFAQAVAAGFRGASAGVEKVVQAKLASAAGKEASQSAQVESVPREVAVSAPSLTKAASDGVAELCSHCNQQVQPDQIAGKLYCSNCGSPWVPAERVADKTPDRASAVLPRGNSWEKLIPQGTPPPARSNHSAVWDAAAGKMYVFGGSGVGVLNDLWVYSAGDNAWERLTPQGTPPPAHASHSAVWDAAAGRMYLFGGYSGGADSLTDLWVYSAGDHPWERLTPQGPACRHHSAVWDAAAGRMYLFGGYSDYGGVGNLNDLWVYSAGDNTWEKLTPQGTPPPARGDHSAVWDAAAGKMYVFGGTDGKNDFDDLWVYTAETASQVCEEQKSVGIPPEPKSQACVYCGSSAAPSIVGGVPYCSECGARLQGDATPRPADRLLASEAGCKNCGSTNPPSTLSSGRYCSDCGRRFD